MILGRGIQIVSQTMQEHTPVKPIDDLIVTSSLVCCQPRHAVEMRAYADLADDFTDIKYDDWVPPAKVRDDPSEPGHMMRVLCECYGCECTR